MALASMGDSLGFAARCKKNLLYIEQARQSGDDVHVVTQIIISSLGLLVFPWEKKADQSIRGTSLSRLRELGWPEWNETKPSQGLGQLVGNLRNAIAHGNVQFSSDDREASKVLITFGSKKGHWQANIHADDLESFCLRFIGLIEETIG